MRAPPAVLLLSLLGCDPADEEPLACTDTEEAVDWENWGAGFFASYCRSCHSADSPDRHDAPEGVDFDSYEQVRKYATLIRTSVLESGTMPVGGGVPYDELELLDVFLACGT